MSGIGENELPLALHLVGGHWLSGMHMGKDTSVPVSPASPQATGKWPQN